MLVASPGFGSAPAAMGDGLDRCGTRSHPPPWSVLFQGTSPASACSATFTDPDPAFEEGALYELKVVVHVLQSADASRGVVPDDQIREQLLVLNEDFRAMAADAGSGAVDTEFTFALATVDPDGQPTNGITRHDNDDWFRDGGRYWDTLAWDPTRYVNVYTNQAGSLLGYTYLPADPESEPGEASDRVVVHWEYLGRVPDDDTKRGRTLTHEMGHYLGLDHTFAPNPTSPPSFICSASDAPDCYSSGDLICDTPAEDAPNEECAPRVTCASDDAIENFMDYTPDACMNRFTREQKLRMRCTVQGYRPNILWPAARVEVSELQREGQFAHLSVSLVNESPVAQRFSMAVESAADLALDEAVNDTLLDPSEALARSVTVDLATASEADTVVTFRTQSDANEQVSVETHLVESSPAPQLRGSGPEVVTVSALESMTVPIQVENLGVLSEPVSFEALGAWAALGSETSQLVGARGSTTASLLVTVPHSAAVGDERTATLRFFSTRAPDLDNRVGVRVTAARWVEAALSVQEGERTVLPGDTGQLTFSLQNVGNDAESFRIVVTSDSFVQAAPRATLVGPVAPFDEDGVRLVTVDFTVDEDADVGATPEIHVQAITDVDGQAVAEATGKLIVTSVGRVGLTPRRQVSSLERDETRTFSLTLTNVAEERDAFLIEVDSESELTMPPTDRIVLSASESVTLPLTLRARGLNRELTRIWARSEGFPNRVQFADIELLAAPLTDASVPYSDAGTTITATDPGCGCRLHQSRFGLSPFLVLIAVVLGLVRRSRAAISSIAATNQTPRAVLDQRLELAVGDGEHCQIVGSRGTELT